MKFTSQPSRRVKWASFFRAFVFLFVATSISAFLLFFAIRYLQGGGQYDAPVMVFDGYHSGDLWVIAEHPIPFLLSISLLLSLSGSLWIVVIAPRVKRYHSLQALLIPWVALILASPVWGLIWSMYRWPPQGFSDPSVMLMFYRHDALFGLSLGWLSGLISFPINILSYITVYGLILLSKKIFLPVGIDS